MNITLADNLRELRRVKGVTQEQLAAHLSVSAQSVSKWETDSGFPDITLLPAIAFFFDTTIDELLGVGKLKQEAKIDEIAAAAYEQSRNGRNAAAEKILRAGVREFPNDYRLLDNLMSCMWQLGFEKGISGELRLQRLHEVIDIGERLLAAPNNTDWKEGAVQLLCYTYPEIGMRDKAVTLAKKQPHHDLCCEELLAQIYEGKEKQNQQLENTSYRIMRFIYDMFCGEIWKTYTTEEKYAVCKKIIAFYDLIFEDGDYGIHRDMLWRVYLYTAKCSTALGSLDDATEYLRVAARHAIYLDEEYNPDEKFTCLLLRGLCFGGIDVSSDENNSMELLDEINKGPFDALREREDFRGVKNTLEKHAKRR